MLKCVVCAAVLTMGAVQVSPLAWGEERAASSTQPTSRPARHPIRPHPVRLQLGEEEAIRRGNEVVRDFESGVPIRDSGRTAAATQPAAVADSTPPAAPWSDAKRDIAVVGGLILLGAMVMVVRALIRGRGAP